MRQNFIFSYACAILTIPFHAFADDAIASHRYLADPSPLVTEDRVYIYCSNDDLSPVEGGFNIPNLVCISSSDMVNWTDHGVVFDAKRDTSWAVKSWAPAAIERDGKYFLYFGNSGANIGVVAADSPIGPFKDIKGTFLIDHSTPGVQPFSGGWLFDPGVFIDDDGQAYIYFGGNGDDHARLAKLNRDMISLDGDVMQMHVPNFFEAAWVFKRHGIYYYSYSTTPKAEMRIDYMTSHDPVSGFVYRGVVADQPPINHNNNHAAQFQFKGNWYHVYHNRNVATEAGIPTGFRRNIAIEPLHFNPDESIQKVEYTNGVTQIGHLNPYTRVEAETFYKQSGIETEPTAAGGMALTSIDDGDWTQVAGIDFGSKGARSFTLEIACDRVPENGKNASIELHIDSVDGPLIGSVSVHSTSGNWENQRIDIEPTFGIRDLYFVFKGDELNGHFKIDSWEFSI